MWMVRFQTYNEASWFQEQSAYRTLRNSIIVICMSNGAEPTIQSQSTIGIRPVVDHLLFCYLRSTECPVEFIFHKKLFSVFGGILGES